MSHRNPPRKTRTSPDGYQFVNTTKRYVWSPVYVDAMILRDRDLNADGMLDERLWVQQDANFNITALVSGSGGGGIVVERYAYDHRHGCARCASRLRAL